MCCIQVCPLLPFAKLIFTLASAYFNQHRAHLGSFSPAIIKNQPYLSQCQLAPDRDAKKKLELAFMCFAQFEDLHHYSKQEGGGMMGYIKLPNAPCTVGLFINANAIMGKRDFISVSLCTYQCVCRTVRARTCMCVWVGGKW